ncbi:MAG: O-antigen ligase family protein [Candidatus Aminicenantes bacterium]|nr:MAG: O-antigen ligase family protein [Candidatus Aminicenantes bacterium]
MNKPKPTLGAYLVGAYLFCVPAFGYSESLGLLIIPQIIGILLVAYAIADILIRQSIKIPIEIRLYGLMGLWAVITFYFAASGGEWAPLITMVKVVIATLACAQLIKSDADFFIALKIFVFSILLIYIQNRGDLLLLRVSDTLTEDDRFAGTLSNANVAAIFSLTVFWACVFLLLKSGKRFFSWVFYLFPMGISLLIIYYSGSKKGLFGIGLFVLFLTRLLYMRQHSSVFRKVLIILVSVSLIIIGGYYIYTSPFFSRIERLFQDMPGTDINRLTLAFEAVDVWLMNLKTFFIGVGYDNFRYFSILQAYSHSTPLELLACNGIIGFSLFAGFLYLLIRKFIFLHRRAVSQETKSVFFSILAFLFIYVFFIMAAVLHDSRELLPLLGGLAALGQYRLGLLEQGRVTEPPISVMHEAVIVPAKDSF